MTEQQRAVSTYLTVHEIATLLRVSRMSAYRLVHTGELAYIRVGRQIRVSRRAFEEYRTRATHEAVGR